MLASWDYFVFIVLYSIHCSLEICLLSSLPAFFIFSLYLRCQILVRYSCFDFSSTGAPFAFGVLLPLLPSVLSSRACSRFLVYVRLSSADGVPVVRLAALSL